MVYQVTGVFTGGLAPLIAAVLLGATGHAYLLVAAYVAGVSLITSVAAYLAPDTRGQEIDDDPRQLLMQTRPRAAIRA